MNFSDIIFVFEWWLMFFLIGIVFLPLTSLIFNKFFDKGYIFSKIIGIAFVSYIVFVLGILKLLPFTLATISIVVIGFLILNIILIRQLPNPNILISLRKSWRFFFFEELLFLLALFFWSFIRAHQPDIQGLEKYMDFGFINSILRSSYFPPVDMWFTPLSINYYYFGHLATAVLTKLSFMPSYITYNLMLSTISSLTFVGAFSIGANLIHAFLATTESRKKHEAQNLSPSSDGSKIFSVSVIAGFLSGLIITFAGNLHTIYLFFKPYQNENPVPFWQLVFSPNTFPNGYWYPNATRFIENTIHEFPIYSSVVADLHGHFLDVPFVLLTIAVLLSFFYQHIILKPERLKDLDSSLRQVRIGFVQNDIMMVTLLSFLLAVMYMTNAWDGIIYFLLTAIVILVIQWRNIHSSQLFNTTNNLFIGLFVYLFIIGVGFFLFSLPFNLNFKPFTSGIGVLCTPEFLTSIGKLGPFLFEKDHCQHSPLWQLFILYGFFYFWVVAFFVFLFRSVILSRIRFGEGSRKILRFAQNDITKSDIFVGILIILSTLLIVIPEFIYVKDIYPAHYRANTMFKLVYQSFIMLSLSSGYIIVRLFLSHKSLITNQKPRYWLLTYWIIGLFVVCIVFLYPYFAINAYYGNLRNYQGLDGTKYLNNLYTTDYQAIQWINKNIKNQPVILEAQGDSYTDYARVSSNTGLPTVLGWTVHEWLWRGSYDIPSPRIEDVKTLYETSDLAVTKQLIKKHNVSLVFIGDLEKQKYPNLYEAKFKTLGKSIYKNGDTKIYQLNNKTSD